MNQTVAFIYILIFIHNQAVKIKFKQTDNCQIKCTFLYLKY